MSKLVVIFLLLSYLSVGVNDVVYFLLKFDVVDSGILVVGELLPMLGI